MKGTNMLAKKYITLWRIMVLSAIISILCSLTLTDWGAWAAIVAAAVVLIGGGISIGSWYRNRKKTRNPIDLVQYKLQDDIKKKELFKASVIQGTVDDVVFHDKPSLNDTMKLLSNKVYLFFLELSPQIPRSVHSVNLRFLGGVGQPQVIDLQDANQETYKKYQGMYEGDGKTWGWKGIYSIPIHIASGKNLYYYACFTTKGRWEGKLSMRFYFVGEDARSVKISCRVGESC